MKVLFLVTHTPNCEPFWRSLEAIGHHVTVVQYDDRPYARHGEIIDEALRLRPDFIVYVGAYEPSHGRPVLQISTLSALNTVAPLALLCGDASDDPWWPVLTEYCLAGCFTVIVNMDGGASPIEAMPNGLTLLTPLDPRPFNPLPWNDRTIRLGTVGGAGHRDAPIRDLQARGLLTYHPGPVGRSYADYAALMCNTKVTLNFGRTGTGRYLQVKGRAVEAGFAGAALLELRGSPLANWFAPGFEYLEYESVEDVARLMATTTDEQFAELATRFHSRMVAKHHPEVFWDTVLRKAGLR